MNKKLQLNIAEPCHENWDKMTPTEKGRFCGSCSKQVVDFTGMSDSQLIAFFRKPATGSVCGRFMQDQLDRPLELPRKRLTWLRYFFSILLPALFLSKAGAQRTMGKPSVERDTTRVPIDHEFRTLGMVLPDHIKPVCPDTSRVKVEMVKVKQVRVNGKVVDEEGKAVPAASIQITQNGKIITADSEGRFNFIAATDKLLEFICTSVGYIPETYLYPFTLQYSSEVDITVQMKKTAREMSEVVLTSIVCNRPLQIVAGGVTVVQRTEEISVDTASKVNAPTDPMVKFYPNPARSGEALHISVSKLEVGYYRWILLDISGRTVQQNEFWVDEHASLLDIQLPLVPPGTYIAVLVNKKTGKRFSEKIIIG